MNARLVQPDAGLRATYLSYIAEMRERDETLIPFPLTYPADDFPVLLARTLDEARGLDLSRVLVTCASDNTDSVGVIEGNGGVLHSEELLPERAQVIRRYWIDL